MCRIFVISCIVVITGMLSGGGMKTCASSRFVDESKAGTVQLQHLRLSSPMILSYDKVNLLPGKLSGQNKLGLGSLTHVSAVTIGKVELLLADGIGTKLGNIPIRRAGIRILDGYEALLDDSVLQEVLVDL